MTAANGRGPLNAGAPRTARAGMNLVNGRTFTVAADDGSLTHAGDGTVFQDIRILDRFDYVVATPGGGPIIREHLSTALVTPFHAISVSRPAEVDGTVNDEPRELYVHRQWVGRGARHVIEIKNAGSDALERHVSVTLGTDFAHLFDVKAGHRSGSPATMVVSTTGDVHLAPAQPAADAIRVRIDSEPEPDRLDAGTLEWRVTCPPRSAVSVAVVAEPEVDGEPVGVFFPIDGAPPRFVPAPPPPDPLTVSSADPRWSIAVERSLADLRSLRIFDPHDPTRVIVAAGAPWFMTLFGRDSLITSWMALPYEPDLAQGTLRELAELQGARTDRDSEEEPGRILHELRRSGGEGAFATRARYYGTVDATPLFVMLAAETARWGHLGGERLASLWPHVVAAIGWVRRLLGEHPQGFLAYERRSEHGLANQGWKDSWDGVSYADGRLATGPIALAEVQGYAYAALRGAAELATRLDQDDLDANMLRLEADDLRDRFNAAFWDEAATSYALGVDGDGERIDAVTSNPGHAIWCGICAPDLAGRYLDAHVAGALWTGWGLRTMAPSAARFNPVSYHNGSVWPHDSALMVAGAARCGRYDLVDRFADGALEAAMHFDGRPPELFAGLDRSDVPAPVPYPSSCSPQAWASASILSLLTSTIGLGPPVDPHDSPVLDRSGGAPLAALGPVLVGDTRHRLQVPA